MVTSTMQVLEVIIGALPCAKTISSIDISDDAVRFYWSADRWRVNRNLLAEKVVGGCLRSDTSACLMTALLHSEWELRNSE
jgi:hypothetical protein